jgi:hypothetical protein
MNIKNTTKIFALIASGAISLSTQCMMNGVKAILHGLSTSIGVILPTAEVPRRIQLLYKCKTEDGYGVKLVEKQAYAQTRNLSDDEEKLLRPYVDKNVKLLIEKENGWNSSTSCTVPGFGGDTIIITEQIAGSPPDTSITKIMEAKKNGAPYIDTGDLAGKFPAEDIFIAQTQHEMGHVKENHAVKQTLFNTGVPVLTTAVAAKLFMKWYPRNINATLKQVAKRSLAKSVGGVALLVANKKLSNLYSKYCEHVADSYIEKSKIPGQLISIHAADFRRKNPVTTTETVTPSKWAKYKQNINHWLNDTHPSSEQRVQRLTQRLKEKV